MTSINPLGATITDISLVEHRIRYVEIQDGQDIFPSISLKNYLVEESSDDSECLVAIESSVSIALETRGARAVQMIYFVVGCTVSAPSGDGGGDVAAGLKRYAVDANIGFARTLLYQQTMISTLPSGLIIPPMEFDGVFDD